jgi:hypothetical protein
MMTLLLAMQMVTVQPSLNPPPDRLIRIDVVLYQGDPSKLATKEKLASPTLMTRDRQKTVVAIGQTIAFRELEKTLINDEAITQTVVNQQFGTTMIFHPQVMKNGQIFLAGSIKTTELGNMNDSIQQKKENDVRVALSCNLNTPVMIPALQPKRLHRKDQSRRNRCYFDHKTLYRKGNVGGIENFRG